MTWFWLLAVLAAPAPEALPSTAESGLVARYRGGVVTRGELAEMQRARTTLAHRPPPGETAWSDLEQLVLWKVLAARTLAEGLAQEPGHARELERAREALAAARLRRALQDETRPSDDEVRAYYDAHRADFSRPRRWQLSNLWKKVPADAPADERERRRQDMEALRRRLEQGEDFATLARAESGSSTRVRGGRAGVVRPEDLRPEAAAVVATLAAGDLSPVIETADGFLLLFCHRVLEPVEVPFERARGAIRRGLWRQAFEPRWEPWSASLGSAAAEARRRGLLDDPDHRAARRWRERELLAGWLIEKVVSARIEPPTEEEVAAFYDAHRASFVEPAAVRARALRMRIDPAKGRGVYRRLEDAAEEARHGGQRLDAILQHLGAGGRDAELLDLGWLAAEALAAAGPNVASAVAALAPGEVSAAVQEGEDLWVLELLERWPERPLAREEAERRIRRRLESRRRTAARRAFEQEALAAQELVVLP